MAKGRVSVVVMLNDDEVQPFSIGEYNRATLIII